MRKRARADRGSCRVGTTYESFRELGRPPGLPVFPRSALDGESLYVCAGYVPGRAFTRPGNRIGLCGGCGHTIQMRPHAPDVARKICVACALQAGMPMPDEGSRLQGDMTP